MTDKLMIENLLNRLLVKCGAEIERRAQSAGGLAYPAQITFERNRCVRTLFPKSSCEKCIRGCQPQVMSLKNQSVSIEGNSSCTGCGKCIRECPTEAFSFGRFPLYGVLSALKTHFSNLRSKSSRSRPLVFVCPKATQEGQEFPTGCFGGVGPALLLLAHLIFNAEIKLHCSDCKKCSAASGKNAAQNLICACEKLSSDLGVDFRPTLFEVQPESNVDLGRRRFFSRVSERLQGICDVASLSGPAPKTDKVFPMLERELLLVAVEILKIKVPEFEIQEKFFPLPVVFKEKCTGCNLCVLLCPSGCLTSKTEDQRFKLLADPLRCVDCGRCIEVCPTKAMDMRSIPGSEEILSDSVRIVLTKDNLHEDESDQSAEARMREFFDTPIYRS